MTGKHTGRQVRLGDRVEIRVESVNLEKREIDFILLEDPDFEPVEQEIVVTPEPKKKRRRKRNKR
jgi:hypothetical protein